MPGSRPTGASWVLWGIPDTDRSLWGPGWGPLPLRPFLFFADFNENGFIDEEDLQRIILRLLNSDDVSEDLLTNLTTHVCALGLRLGEGGRTIPQGPRWQAG